MRIILEGTELVGVGRNIKIVAVETTENYYISSTKEAGINIENIIESKVINEIIKI